MWLRSSIVLCVSLLVAGQEPNFNEETSSPAGDGLGMGLDGNADVDGSDAEQARENGQAMVEEHHLFHHTKSHNPCSMRKCSQRQVCKVVINPVLQFPVAHCKEAFSPADAAPSKAKQSPTGKEVCNAQELSTGPMSCYTKVVWQQKARDHCGKATMNQFTVQTQCLSFDPMPVYQFVNFQCCSKADAAGSAAKPPAKQPAKKMPPKKPAPPPPLPPHPASTAEGKQPVPEKQPSHAAEEPSLPKKIPAATQPKQQVPDIKPPPPKAKSPQPEAPKEKSHPEIPKPKQEERPAPVNVPHIPDQVNNEVKNTGADQDSSRFDDHWIAIAAAGLIILVGVATMIAVAYRMKKNKQVFHKKRILLSDGNGTVLAHHARASSTDQDSDEEMFMPGAEDLAFDDTEVKPYLNPMGLFTNVGVMDESQPAVFEPSEIDNWAMDDDVPTAMNLARRIKN